MEKEIKCHLCKGRALLHFEELSLDNGKIIIKNSPYYKCGNCREEFATSEQMQELSEEINKKFSFLRPIINAGRSLAITLPKDLINYYRLKKGKSIRIVPESRNRMQLILE